MDAKIYRNPEQHLKHEKIKKEQKKKKVLFLTPGKNKQIYRLT